MRLTFEPTLGVGPGAKTQIDVVERSGDNHMLKLNVSSEEGEKTTTKREISSIEVEKLVGLLTTTAITALPLGQLVCDGTFITLELNYWGISSKFTWPSVAPESWGVLEEVVRRLRALAGIAE